MDPIDWLCLCWTCFAAGFTAGFAAGAVVAAWLYPREGGGR